MSNKHFDPSKTFKVVKCFVEGGRKFNVGDTYVPRFKSSKRAFRHWVARRIVHEEQVEQPIQQKEEVEKKVDEGVNEDVAKVVVDDGDDFQVEYKGVQFEVARNQVRKDGTLTSGGLKAYNKALEN